MSLNVLMCAGDDQLCANNFDCLGIENGLSNCQRKESDSSGTSSVVCTSVKSNIRLVGGATPYEGRVEMLMGEGNERRWTAVCHDDHWSTEEAVVACRQMGFSGASHVRPREEFHVGGALSLRYIKWWDSALLSLITAQDSLRRK